MFGYLVLDTLVLVTCTRITVRNAANMDKYLHRYTSPKVAQRLRWGDLKDRDIKLK
jgi:hypothetical protein